MNYEFPIATSIDEQINNLKNNGLIFQDEDLARRKLSEVSYYRLIKAYSPPFKEKNGKFKPNTTFEKICSCYEFDDELRHLLIPYIERIEITLRCRITNHFSQKYGTAGYLEKQNFDPDSTEYYKLHDKIIYVLENNDSPSIKHFKKKYDGIVPLYAAIEQFSLGVLSMFYNTMKKEDRSAIADMYPGINVHAMYLGSWVHSISNVRNICAHYGRFINFPLRIKPKLYSNPDKDVDSNRLFAVLCCMRFLCVEYGDWASFVTSLKDLLDDYNASVKPEHIGCSPNWEKKLLDQEKEGDTAVLVRYLSI